MAELVLGPLLRHVGERDASIWVETDAPCGVEMLGTTARTFAVAGHHYALVDATGLEPGTDYEYEVTARRRHVWPVETHGFPAPPLPHLPEGQPVRVSFGSCRVAPPHVEPYTLRKDEDDRGREIDSLRTLALGLPARPFEEWPDLLIHLGDQVYADEVPPETAEPSRRGRDTQRSRG